MAQYDGSIRIDTRVDTSGFNTGVSAVSRGFSAIISAASAVGIALSAAFVVDKIIEFGKEAVSLASDMQEVQNVVETAFGSMSYKCEEFAKTSIETLGMSKLAAKQFSSTYMAMGRGSGMALEEAADMALGATKRIGDIASFYNKSFEEVDTMLKSIWTGETESLKEIGVVMTQANLQQFAYTQGINKKISAMTQAEQIQLRYAYVMEQTALAEGDFAKTSDSWANQTRILSERWKEFLSIVGSGLIEVLLPFVKFLNRILEILILIAEGIGYIFSIITGKNPNDDTDKLGQSIKDLSNSAGSAAENENNLADGINSAAKAAKSALAQFDQLDVLQRDLGSSGGNGSGNFDYDGNDFDLDFGFDDIDTDLDEIDYKFDNFLIGLKDKIKEFETVPVFVPQPIFAPLPDPIYNPNWGLDLPIILDPVFQPIPSLIYNPNWGLEVPKVEAPIFPPIPIPIYNPNWGLEVPKVEAPIFPPIPIPIYNPDWGLEVPKVETPIFPPIPIPIYNPDWGLNNSLAAESLLVLTTLGLLNTGLQNNLIAMELSFQNAAKVITEAINGADTAISAALGNISTNVSTTKENISGYFENLYIAVVNDMEQMKASVTTSVYETCSNIMSNMGIALEGIDETVVNWVNSTASNFVIWGTGVVNTVYEAAVGVRDTFVSGLKSAWESFVSFIEATGEKAENVWSEHKTAIITAAAITGAVAVTAAVIASGGSLLPALAAVPMLAEGAVIPPNQEFLAILGDQKSGRNIETPESLIRQIMREEMEGFMGVGSDFTVDMPVYLDGEVIYRNVQRISRRRGKSLITGGVIDD
ncbi:hypothetical protein B5E58_11210 [Tyzzerella sp. An114]|uniref:hypothetical protein n=1 Tax=Tyzzerella sp. An114 TaxID=1965545 RepID=UPI000B433053|nr:hypothetical protein [Tyzzerella sp. An114]OUQ56235.1 hypothetical protein B5E58_11210 [Tyzzerella sp. An114]